MKINGNDRCQDAVLARLTKLNGVELETVLALEPILRRVSGVTLLAKAAGELLDISAETGADTRQLAISLTMVKAARHGAVLSPSPIRVQIDDVARSAPGDVDEDQGILFESGGGLSVFLRDRQETYRVMGPAACDGWETTPQALADNIDTVFLDIGEGGDFDVQILIGDFELDMCGSIEDFFKRGNEHANPNII